MESVLHDDQSVRQLNFVNPPGQASVWVSLGFYGVEYTITKTAQGKFNLLRQAAIGLSTPHGTLDEAMDAAQKDFSRHICKAIVRA